MYYIKNVNVIFPVRHDYVLTIIDTLEVPRPFLLVAIPSNILYILRYVDYVCRF
jgi:hypothetical protein